MAQQIPRPIRIEGDVAYVPLTKGYEAIIDAADVPLVCSRNWWALEARHKGSPDIRTVYAQARFGGLNVYLHRVLIGLDSPLQIDHRNGDGLDCRRANLREATPSENARNSRTPTRNRSGVKGVWWDVARSKWGAGITKNGVAHKLGRFGCITAAALAYAKASREMHGDFGLVEWGAPT